jgi:two-component system chemotaxis response regulator CheY
MVNVLLVDDAAYMRKLLQMMLEKGGHVVVGEARSGTEGVEQYKELKPDLVIMDITMPEMGGIAALIKILEYDKDAKVLMCTASDQTSHREDANNAGAVGYLVKPIKRAEFLEKIAEVCPT